MQQVLSQYDELRAKLPQEQRDDLTRSLGLKMEQLKAELEIILDASDH